MSNFKHIFFSFKGTINRSEFWFGFIVLCVIGFASDYYLSIYFNGVSPYALDFDDSMLLNTYYRISVSVIYLLLLVPAAPILIKRANDAGAHYTVFIAYLCVMVLIEVLYGLKIVLVDDDISVSETWLTLISLVLFFWTHISLGFRKSLAIST